jgi:hypothetical protein
MQGWAVPRADARRRCPDGDGDGDADADADGDADGEGEGQADRAGARVKPSFTNSRPRCAHGQQPSRAIALR